MAELGQRLSVQEFTAWRAYYQLEPWGAWRDNWHHANLAALLANIHRGKGQPIQAHAFMFEAPEDRVEREKRTLSQRALAFIRGNNQRQVTDDRSR